MDWLDPHMLYLGGSAEPAKCSLIIYNAIIRGYHKCQLMPIKTNGKIIQNHRLKANCQVQWNPIKYPIFSNYAVLIIPFLKLLTPSILLIHWEYLSCFILSSSWIAHCLLLASCLLPGPTWWILDRRHPTWALTAVTESLLLICPTIKANSLSEPWSGLPSCCIWNLSLHWASVSTKLCTSSDPSPQAPKHRPIICPNSSSLLSTGPLPWSDVPGMFLSRFLAFLL